MSKSEYTSTVPKMEIDWDYFNNVIDIADVAALLGIEINNKDFFLCPAHDDNHPSAQLSTSKNRWHCFSCGEGGSPINLVMAVNGGNTLDAVLFLDKYYPGGIKYIDREQYDDTPYISIEMLKKIGLKQNPFLEKNIRVIVNEESKKVSRSFSLNPLDAASMVLEKALNYQLRLQEYQDQFLKLYPGLDQNAHNYIAQRTKEQVQSVDGLIATMREYIETHTEQYLDQFAYCPDNVAQFDSAYDLLPEYQKKLEEEYERD